jgi:hypothetical protein
MSSVRVEDACIGKAKNLDQGLIGDIDERRFQRLEWARS